MLTHHSVSGAWELKSDDDMYYHSKVSFFVSLLTALESTENDWNDWKFRSFCLEAYLILFLSVLIEIKKVFSFMMDLSSESSMDVLVQFVSNRLERALPYTHSFLCSQWAAERSDGRRESREKGVNEKRIATGRAPADLSHGLHASLQLRVLWCVQDAHSYMHYQKYVHTHTNLHFCLLKGELTSRWGSVRSVHIRFHLLFLCLNAGFNQQLHRLGSTLSFSVNHEKHGHV